MADEIVLTDENIPPMQTELFRLYSQGFLTDITLSCEDGKNFEAHRVLLAARSQYFYGIVPKLKVEPVIFLKGVKGSHLEKILKYIYSGSATVSRSQLKSVLEVARSLQVRGLQDLAPTELSRGTNTSFQGHSKYSGSKTSSPIPSKSKDDSFHRLSPQSARDVALQQQQKLYDKISLSSKKSPLGKHNSSANQFSSSKKSKQSLGKDSKSLKDDDNGEEIFKFQYQYISDDSDDKDDSNDSDFEVADKKNTKELATEVTGKKKRGRPPKVYSQNNSTLQLKEKKNVGKEDSDLEFRNNRKSSKSSTDDDTDNSSDLDQDDSDSESEADSDDVSGSDDDEEDDEDDRGASSRLSHHSARVDSPRAGGKSGSGSKGRGGADSYYDAPPPAPATPPTATPSPRRRVRGPSINGKQMLAVQCKGKRGELYLSKFGNGTSGKSIKYKGVWMTPDDYELACGVKSKKYLESITTDYGPLKTLTVSGLLKPCPKKCRCNVCLDEVNTSPEVQQKSNKDEKDHRTPSKSDTAKEKLPVKKRDGSPSVSGDSDNKKRKQDSDTDKVRTQPQSQGLPSRPLTSKSSSGRDKAASNKPMEHSTSKPAASTSSPSKLSPSITKSDIISPATLSSTKSISSSLTSAPSVSTSSTFSPSSSKPLASPSFIAMTPATSLSTLPSLATCTSSAISTATFAAKFTSSPPVTTSSTQSLNHSPLASSLAAGTVTTSSSLASLTSPAPPSTPSSHAAAAGAAAGHPAKAAESRGQTPLGPATTASPGSVYSPAPSQTKTGVAAGQTPEAGLVTSGHHSSKSGHAHHHGRQLGPVMTVRCKSVSAQLFVNKYESGSKGKCILAGDEWMTPNEFEEKAGSKAKKYLSSIKCLGRPLRAYVNSGELRGSGPAPSPKPPKINKPKPPQPIAPAPAPGQSHASSGYSLPPPGMSSSHQLGASMPQSLTQVAMMSGGSVAAGQPILLNQSNLAAVSIAGAGVGGVGGVGQSSMNQVGTPILQPMTFTFAPMSMQGQQLQHQQLQHQQLHPGPAVGQQLHSSADYILQHK